MRSRLTLILIGIAATQLGCSLKPGQAPGIGLNVKLAPPQSQFQERSLLNQDWMSLMALPSNAPVDCYGVNVRGGTIATSSVCGAQADLGITAGFVADVNSTFAMSNVPLSDGLVFEAFGYQGSCGAFSPKGGLPSGTLVYPLGSAQPAASDLGGTVTIPITFNPSKGLNCQVTPGGVPTTLLTDSFNYAPGGALSTLVGTKWPVSGAGDLTAANPGVTLTLPGAVFSDFAVGVESYNQPVFVITMQLHATSVGFSTIGDVPIAMGLSDGASDVTANTVGCILNFHCTGGGGTGCSVSMAAGKGVASLFTANPLTGTNTYNMSDNLSFVCTIDRLGGGLDLVVATAVDATTTTTYTQVVSGVFADPCTGAGCTDAYIAQGAASGGLLSFAGLIDAYTLIGIP